MLGFITADNMQTIFLNCSSPVSETYTLSMVRILNCKCHGRGCDSCLMEGSQSNRIVSIGPKRVRWRMSIPTGGNCRCEGSYVRNDTWSSETSKRHSRLCEGRQEGEWDSNCEKTVETGRVHSMKTLVF